MGFSLFVNFKEAERMHKKAIKIKTDLLGPYDFEVGLSIGHLASLYNYQMKKYREAEELYLKSIDISMYPPFAIQTINPFHCCFFCRLTFIWSFIFWFRI